MVRDQIIAKRAGPKNITIDQIIFHIGVIGYISPYQTVAAVTIHHHNDFAIDENSGFTGFSIS